VPFIFPSYIEKNLGYNLLQILIFLASFKSFYMMNEKEAFLKASLLTPFLKVKKLKIITRHVKDNYHY
jgi:hypothetical protein